MTPHVTDHPRLFRNSAKAFPYSGKWSLPKAPAESPNGAQGPPEPPLPSMMPLPNLHPHAAPAQRPVLSQEPPQLPGEAPHTPPYSEQATL